MKKFLFLPLCFLSLCVATIPPVEKQQALQQIKQFPGMSKNELFSSTMMFIAKSYNSANDLIQLKDPENGQIICQGIGSAIFDMGFERHFKYTMIIDIKEEKMRVSFENIQSYSVGEVAGPDMNYQWQKVENYFKVLETNLFSSINQRNNDNW